MFLRKLLLLDPDEERRRKHLRAQIIRRNRIKKEIEQGLEPSAHRRGYQPSTKDDSVFIPTFGGNSDHHGRSNDRYIAGTLRTSTRPVAREPTLEDNTVESVIATEKIVSTVFVQQSSSTKDDAVKGYHSPLPAEPHRAALRSAVPGIAAPKQPPPISKAKARWRDAFHEVIFRRHEEILRKDPNRKWRQERFGLLLFDKKEYERAAKHLTLAITLGASSNACWRRLAQSHFHTWESKNDWDTLWDAKGAYEQAMSHLEIACNPFALFEYAKVFEGLGMYTGALSVCASILQTFPRFQWLHRVMFRFVLLQRYQIFSTGGESLTGGGSSISLETIEKESMLLKCVRYTKMLLLNKQTAKGELDVCVLYMHARLNELLAVSITSAGGGQAAAKTAQESSDHSFEELFKVAIAKKLVVSTTPLSWKTWKAKSDTYIALAGYFHDQNEPIPAADALSRALDLLEVPLIRASTDARVDTSEQSRSKLSLYIELGRNYYQCNQMEKAIRSMEVVFQMNPFHEEARASLSAWFPAKWKYRLELEDASQVQIARVIRGIWGRNRAHRRRQEVVRALEMKYNENPYHPLHRRNILRVLMTKYAPLFMVQDISARCIQARARRYLYYARTRWSLEDQRAKCLQQLKSKQQTRKYRYNRHVREQLAQLLPEQFEDRFQQEDRAALYIQVPHANACHHTPIFGFGFDTNPFFVLPMLPQRRFRGERVRRAFRVRRDAHRSKIRQENEAAHCIQRFYHRHCRRQTSSDKLSPEELLYRAHQKIAQARERVARNLQQLYRRRWKSVSSSQRLPSLFEASQQNVEKKILHRHTSAIMIQREWRRHVARKELGFRGFDDAKVLVQQLKRGHEQQRIATEDDLELAARKIQALYRGKRIRNSLCKIRRVFAPVSESTILSLIDSCESNCHEGVESCVTLHRVQSLEEKRALFDYPVVILDPPATSSIDDISTEVAPFPLQHLVAAIEHNARLRCLVCASGDFQGDRIGLLFSSLKNSWSLQVLALGRIQTDNLFTKEQETQSEQHGRQVTPEDDDDGVDGDLELPSHDIASSQPISQRRVSHQPLDASKQSPMRSLSQVLCTVNFMLEELYMEDNTLLRDPTEGSCVAGFLGDFFFARYGRLKKLVLAKMHFSDTNAALLGPALAINTILQYLDLHGNLIGDNGAASIANHGLAHNRSLTYLNLAENLIGSPGAKALFECLAHRNQTLVTLVLCNNNVLNDTIPAFTDAWQLNPTILHIDLRGNLINNNHLDAVHGAMQERRASSSSESELRLFLARKRFSLTLSPSAMSRAQSPLKSISSRSSSKKGKRPAKVALSPTAFLRQAKQNNPAGMHATAAFIRSPLAVYKQQQQIEYSSYDHKHDSINSTAVSPAVSVASASVLALVSPARTAAPSSSSSRKRKPARYETKLPAIHHRAINW